MRHVLGFTTALAFALLVGGLVRATALSGADTPAEPSVQEQQIEHKDQLQDPGETGKPDKETEKVDDPKKEEPKKEQPEAEVPEPATELENADDPVSAEAVGETPTVLEHKGWKIRFKDEASRDKFLKKPIRYYATLSLEPTTDGKLLKVDASKYEKAAPATCGIMGGDIDADGDVFIFHRGFKVFFCCWSGCADEFISDPAKYYDHYGLVEKDGKLVRK